MDDVYVPCRRGAGRTAKVSPRCDHHRSLAAWIADPQTLKPGNNMPMVPLNAEELRSISAYLASLK
jgi:cytochrome c1